MALSSDSIQMLSNVHCIIVLLFLPQTDRDVEPTTTQRAHGLHVFIINNAASQKPVEKSPPK